MSIRHRLTVALATCVLGAWSTSLAADEVWSQPYQPPLNQGRPQQHQQPADEGQLQQYQQLLSRYKQTYDDYALRHDRISTMVSASFQAINSQADLAAVTASNQTDMDQDNQELAMYAEFRNLFHAIFSALPALQSQDQQLSSLSGQLNALLKTRQDVLQQRANTLTQQQQLDPWDNQSDIPAWNTLVSEINSENEQQANLANQITQLDAKLASVVQTAGDTLQQLVAQEQKRQQQTQQQAQVRAPQAAAPAAAPPPAKGFR